MKMAHEHLNDILTPLEIKDARIEARQRHPNHNIDAIMETEFCTYVSYPHNSILQQQCENSINRRLKEMLELQYSPCCIRLYEQIYIALKDNLEQGDI